MKLARQIAALFGATALAALGAAEPALATIQYNSNNAATGFDATAANALPAGWVSVSGSYKAITGAPVVPSHTNSMSDTTKTLNDVAILTGPAAIADMEVTSTQIVIVNTGSYLIYNGIRVRSNAAATSGYLINLTNTSGTMYLQLYKQISNTYTQVGANVSTGITYSTTAGTQIPLNLRVSIVGSAITAKAWVVGTAEPSSPQLSTTDTSVTGTGDAGLVNASATTYGNYTTGVTDFVLNDNPGGEATGMTLLTPVAGTGTATASGVYQGAAPTGLGYALDGATTFTAVASPTISGGAFSFALPSLATGDHQLSLQNTGATTETTATPAFQVSNPATAYTLSGPTGGNVGAASSSFTVQANGVLSAAVTITPSDGGGGGAFSPASVTLAAGSSSSATLTYTPATAGTKTISSTNSGSLTNPASLSYAATVANILAVNSASFKFSPYNWKGDTGRGGSVYRQTWNYGAWFTAVWHGSASPTATIQIASGNSGVVSYFMNGHLVDRVAATGNLVISPSSLVANGTNTLTLFLASTGTDRATHWANGTGHIQIQGILLDSSSTPGVAPAPGIPALIIGDSITEGYYAVSSGTDSFMYSHTYMILAELAAKGYDVGVSAMDGSGFLTQGGNVPPYYVVTSGAYSEAASRWDKIDAGVSLLDANGQLSAYGQTGTPPAFILIDYLGNDVTQGKSLSDLQLSVQGTITALHAAAPAAKILMVEELPVEYPGWNGNSPSTQTSYLNAWTAGIAAAAVPQETTIDLGIGLATQIYVNGSAYLSDSVTHPNIYGHSLEAPAYQQAIDAALSPPAATSFHSGFSH